MNKTISVILPVYNEVAIIEEVVNSLLRQKVHPYELEILLIDGMSTDGTGVILERLATSDKRIRVFVNGNRRTPYAMNLGLKEASGEFVCIFGAHCTYDGDYIAVCLQEALKHGAVGCSGKVITKPGTQSLQAKIVAWTISHPFGASRKSFRTQREGYVDTVPYPVYRKQTLLDVGGYDESLSRNQDNDMNYRLRKSGYKLFCTWKTNCYYYGKRTLKELCLSTYNVGYWNALSLTVRPQALAFRHYAPLIFTCIISLGICAALTSLFIGRENLMLPVLGGMIVVSLHLLIGVIVGVKLAHKTQSVLPLLTPGVFFLYHFTYGLGHLSGLITVVGRAGSKLHIKKKLSQGRV